MLSRRIDINQILKQIGIAVNPLKQGAAALAHELESWFISRGLSVIVADQTSQSAVDETDAFSEIEIKAASADLLLVLGGDGTMLRWSRLTAPLGTPMFGINYGQYGFITEIHPDEALSAMQSILDGNYGISTRLVLNASIIRANELVENHFALNEVVVGKGPIARMLALNMRISGKQIVTYMADGIIVSTPTGSTAYSLSAGGPVVHPGVEVMVITPICPHTLSERALVISDSETVDISTESGEYDRLAALTIDGQHAKPLLYGDSIRVRKADFDARLIQIEPLSFYNKLQTRLHWGERFS